MIVVHRLLKNAVVEATGVRGLRALQPGACVDAMGDRPGRARDCVEHAETYDHIGEVPVWVARPRAPLAGRGGARRASSSRPTDALIALEFDLPAPPQIAWEFLDLARLAGRAGSHGVDGRRRARRRRAAGAGAGTANHCMHGKDAIVEEILDWRPYDYLTTRSTMPMPGAPKRHDARTTLSATPDGHAPHRSGSRVRGSRRADRCLVVDGSDAQRSSRSDRSRAGG